MARVNMRHNKLLVLICINLSNMICHAVYSVLAAFFPQEAKAKGMGDDTVGLIFATFAAVIFITCPAAGRLMSRHGKVRVYVSGLVLVSVATIFFSLAGRLDAGAPFAAWCLVFRVLQGIGCAMEETAAYAIIADVDTDNRTFFMGISEVSTGLGYMIGPPLGGSLFSLGGFQAPFVTLGLLLLPAALLIYRNVPLDGRSDKEDAKGDIPLRALLRRPQVGAPRHRPAPHPSPRAADPRAASAAQIFVIAVASMLANSDYAFLEPTLGDHAMGSQLATSPDSIGILFSVASITYTLACPVIGLLASRDRFGPRPVIVSGLLLQLLGFLLIGPSPFLRLEGIKMGQLLVALVLFGVGESMSMTPVMDDMMESCGEYADAAVNSLSAVITASFSLGQMVGPIVGSGLTKRIGFPWASTAMALVLLVHTSAIMAADVWSPRPRRKPEASYMELTAVNVPTAESAVDD